MEENELDAVIDGEGMRDENINISDVIEVIETDPDFPKESSNNQANASNTMYNGGGEVPNYVPPNPTQSQSQPRSSGRSGYEIKILEQPAPKALRFRYECEGRSAGSIPGASSTPENKTFPTIKVVGGPPRRAVVVVSCVTKDDFRPHPHNLVGREGCKKGVCTLEIPPETMTVSFSNLGIQCVKKKDIEAALRVREEIRVDPYRTGFSHRNQPTTIDLNAVRLCFQVFLENESQKGKFTVQLPPKVSEPIYDKKAMSDLNIIKLSDCVSYVDGGRKDIILLCEKVAKEDIQVRFYEKKDGQIVWEAFADIQPSQVHKQHAIWFRTPRYKTLDVTDKVPVFIQLRRPSDGATSEALPFELLPLDSGRPTYWTYRRHMAKKGNFNVLNSLLAESNKQVQDVPMSEVQPPSKVVMDKPVTIDPIKIIPVASDLKNREANILLIDDEPMITETIKTTVTQPVVEPWSDYAEVQKIKEIAQNNNNNNTEEKSFNDIINQVAELDEIYSDTQARLLNENLTNVEKPTLAQIPQNESFDDSKTYSSLQLAFKNPLDIEVSQSYDVTPTDVIPPPLPPSSSANKRENTEEKLPPLPPKRTKKIETYIGGSMTSIQLTGKQAENLLHRSNSSIKGVPVSRSQSFNLHRPKSQAEVYNNPNKQLPPTPNYSTLPNPKKRGFFSKIFGKKSKTPSASRETSVTPVGKRNSFSSSKSLQVETNLGKSSGNISTHSANSIRIPLKDDSPTNSNNNLSKSANALNETTNQKSNLTTINPDDIDMNLDLTEAEHYALYTAIAPHATQSEFDEMSCYYAPVEGGIPKKKRTLDSSYSELLGEPSTFLQVPTNNIKHEPRETHSPFYGGFPNVSPQSYNPSPSPDPHVYAHSPEMTYNLPFASPMNITQQAWDAPGPSTSKSPNLEPTWNIPQGSNNPSPIQVTQNWTGNNVGNSTLLDLDNHQINSADLNIPMSQDMMPDLNNLSLSDIVPDHNTTDSLTRIVNNAAENMLNN